MLLQEKTVKRHSFSIESLAVSSHVDDNERDTDSPFLQYLQNKNSSVDVNSNVSSKSWTATQHHALDYSKERMVVSTPQATSTPIPDTSYGRRFNSTSTPPSSDESQAVSGEWDQMSIDDSNLVIDESSSTSTETREKLSPASSSASELEQNSSTGSTCKRKKSRTAFTSEQLKELERRYKTQKYLTASDRSTLARTLKLKDQQVKTWFQNRRMKEKRQQREDEQCQTFSLPTGGVDVSQLTALGICPPPYVHQLGTTSPINHHFSASTATAHPSCPVPANITAATDTSTAILRPIPSTAHVQDRDSAFMDMRNARYRNTDMRRDGHFVANSVVSSPLSPYHGVPFGVQFPFTAVPNFNMPYFGKGPESVFQSPCFKGS